MARVFLIHGWTGTNKQDFFPWAKQTLQDKGYEVFAPEMPDTNNPKIKDWLQKLEETVGELKEDDIFIGHSLGCQAILRFLETKNGKVDRVILIAGAQKLSKKAIPLPEDEEIFSPWRDTPINFNKLRNMANKYIAVYSDNDPWVLLDENKGIYKKELNAEVFIEKGKGHFMETEGGVKEIQLLERLL